MKTYPSATRKVPNTWQSEPKEVTTLDTIEEETLTDELYPEEELLKESWPIRNLSRRDSALRSSLASIDLTSIGIICHWQSKEVRPMEDMVKEFEEYLLDIGVRI